LQLVFTGFGDFQMKDAAWKEATLELELKVERLEAMADLQSKVSENTLAVVDLLMKQTSEMAELIGRLAKQLNK
jgi:hypothetical protein